VNNRRARWHDHGRGPRVVIDIGSESVVTTADHARELRDDLTAVLEEIYAAAGPKRDGDHLAALEAVAESAAADVALYHTKGGGPTRDDERVGRMLARDPVIAAQLPDAIADRAAAMLVAPTEGSAGWRAGIEASIHHLQAMARKPRDLWQPAYFAAVDEAMVHLGAMLERGTDRSTTPVAATERERDRVAELESELAASEEQRDVYRDRARRMSPVVAAADAWLDDPCKGLGSHREHDLDAAVRTYRSAAPAPNADQAASSLEVTTT
jgi:hypothetical protein